MSFIKYIADESHYKEVLSLVRNAKRTVWIGTRLTSPMAITTTRLLRTTVVVTDRATSDAGNSILLYICLATGHGESQGWGSLICLIFLIFCRRNSRKLTCRFVTFNFIRKHKIVDLSATTKGLGKYNRLFSCGIYPVFDCSIHN